MILTQIRPHLYSIQLGMVRAFLIDAGELTLVDTGMPGSGEEIANTVRELGRDPSEIRHILVTHCHPDHAGSLAKLKSLTGAPAYMHPLDAAVVRGDTPGRRMKPAPGVFNWLIVKAFISQPPSPISLVRVEHEILDGDELPIAGGIRAVHVPGHTCGHMAFLWHRHGGVLFVGDAAGNMMGLRLSLGYEDLALALRSLAKLSRLRFEVACFSHGNAIGPGASREFMAKWGQPNGG